MVQRGNFKNLPENAEPFAITVSYDMGRQKRACGKVYDSLSGHFLWGLLPEMLSLQGFYKNIVLYVQRTQKRHAHSPS